MAKLLEMPKLSPTMEEGQIGAWKKNEGDAVGVDDLLAEVETDKATMEFRSFDKGTLLKILAPAGSMVKLGQAVAILGEPGEDVAKLVAQAGGASNNNDAAPATPATQAPAARAEAPAPAPAEAAPARADAKPTEADAKPGKPAEAPAGNKPASNGEAPSFGADGRVKASPYVRKMAREQGLDLRAVAGTGPQGRIVARDVEGKTAAPVAARPAARPSTEADVETRPHSMMRRTIARRLTEAKQTIPHFYLTIDVDAEPLHQLRERTNADLVASLGEAAPKLSVNDYIVKAAAIALVRFPRANAQFTPEAILLHKRVHISVAVAIDDGLVTPVIRDADKASVLDISKQTRDLAGRARQKKLAPEEMVGGTFSISNLGMFGIDEFSAVINPPEGAILAIGQIRREPVVQGDAVVPGRRLSMTLSCDHRVIDGAVGAQYLKELRSLLEHPHQILVS